MITANEVRDKIRQDINNFALGEEITLEISKQLQRIHNAIEEAIVSDCPDKIPTQITVLVPKNTSAPEFFNIVLRTKISEALADAGYMFKWEVLKKSNMLIVYWLNDEGIK